MSLSNQLAEAVSGGDESSSFYTPKTFQAATSKMLSRLADASGGPWEAMKLEGPTSRKIAGGSEVYLSQKWYPKDRGMHMGAELIVTLSGGKFDAVFSIDKKAKAIYTEKKHAGNLGEITTWIGTLVSPE